MFRLHLIVWSLLMGFSSRSLADKAIPVENQQAMTAPELSSFEPKAKLLIQAIEKNQPELALAVFFPEASFIQLKAIAKPEAYYQQLISWFKEDIAREHERIAGQEPLEFAGLKTGSCKWKAKGTEANSIPYWSCSKTKVLVKRGTHQEIIELKTRINWGREWYITHLGPIPKAH